MLKRAVAERRQSDRYRRLVRAVRRRGADLRGAAPLPRRSRDRHQGRARRAPARAIGGRSDARSTCASSASCRCAISTWIRLSCSSCTGSTPRSRSPSRSASSSCCRRRARSGTSDCRRSPSPSSRRPARPPRSSSVQNLYNLANRKAEDLLDHCEAEGIAFIPWFPLATGKLAGSGGPLDQIASEDDASPSQLALAWLLRRSPVMLPIPGTSSVAHLEDNLARGQDRADRRAVRDAVEHRRVDPTGARPRADYRPRLRPSLSVGGALLLVDRVVDDPDVGLGRLPLAEDLLGLVVGDRAGDDHVVTLLPLRRGRDLVVRGQLQ